MEFTCNLKIRHASLLLNFARSPPPIQISGVGVVSLEEIPRSTIYRKKLSWTDRVKNEVLHRLKEEWNVLHRIKRRKTKWIRHILRRNCLVKRVIKGKIDEAERRGR